MKRILVVIIVLFFCIYSIFALDYEQVFGIYKIILHEKPGTFSLLMNRGDYKYIPIISSLDSSSSTKFYVKIDNKVYVLSKKTGIPVSQQLLPNGMQLIYTVKDKALITLDITFANSTDGQLSENSDIICFNITIENLDTISHDFSLKTVFDTCLGESSGCHFSTETFLQINDEMEFTSMFADKYIRTSDLKNSIQFLLDGNTITRPLSVVLANKDFLNTEEWTPKVKSGRGFHSLFSYNNSAICIYWNSEQLKTKEKQNSRFYISGARNELKPADINAMYFSEGLDVKNSKEIIVNTVSPELLVDSSQGVQKPESSNAVITANNNDIVVTREMLDEDYINGLLQRIEEMEKDVSKVDKNELAALNNELDAILRKMRE